jgi:hypothetical protein
MYSRNFLAGAQFLDAVVKQISRCRIAGDDTAGLK